MLKEGQRFGMLTVIGFDHRAGKKYHYRYYYKCKCDCGNEVITREDGLTSGHTKSCGCLQKETARKMKIKNGMSGTRFYSIWSNMKARCFNTTSFPEAHCYSLRGISMCNEWKDFQIFYDDMYESYIDHVNEYGEKDTTIDRIDVDRNYEKENCKWSTLREQFNNKTNNHFIEYNGERNTVANWARKLNMSYSVLISRIQRGWSIERAFTTPVIKRRHKDNGNI